MFNTLTFNGVGQCLDVAFLKLVRIDNLVGRGADAAGGPGGGAKCVSVVSDLPNVATNHTGVAFSASDGIQVRGSDISGFATGAYLASGTNISFSANYWHDNAQAGGRGIGVFVQRVASGPFASGAHPPGGITITGDRFANNTGPAGECDVLVGVPGGIRSAVGAGRGGQQGARPNARAQGGPGLPLAARSRRAEEHDKTDRDSRTKGEEFMQNPAGKNIVLSRRAALALGAGAVLAPRASAEPRGLLITGGPIYTGLGDGERVEAVVTRGDRIIFTGELAEARAVSSGARHIDLGGAAAYPGFTDCHCHLVEVGLAQMTLDLVGVGSVPELQARLKAWAAEHPTGPIVGRGWIETHWPEHRFPTRADLDAVVADRPVLLERADGHAVVVNSKTLDAAGVGASTPNPQGGEILRDVSGAATGMIIDKAQALVRPVFPEPDAAMILEASMRADKLYRSRGWTGVHHMSVSTEYLTTLRGMAARDALGLRVDNYMDVDYAAEVFATGPSADPTGRVRLRGIKLYADGALGSRGAALLAPYSDRPESSAWCARRPRRWSAICRRPRR